MNRYDSIDNWHKKPEMPKPQEMRVVQDGLGDLSKATKWDYFWFYATGVLFFGSVAACMIQMIVLNVIGILKCLKG